MTNNWHTITSRDEIPMWLNHMGLMGEAVEVGVGRGVYSQVILQHWQGKKLWMVDCWEQQEEAIYNDMFNSVAEQQQQNMIDAIFSIAPAWDRAGILKLFSEQAVKLFEDGSLDFVYIDANHHTGIKRDLEIWYPKVKSGGVFAGHDYFDNSHLADHDNHSIVKVAPVVDEFFNDKEHVSCVVGHSKTSRCGIISTPSWLIIKD